MSSRKSEEESILPALSDEAVEETNNYIKEAFNILERERNKVRKEKEAFDEVAKKLEHVHFSKIVMLNVGGHFFSTSLATLNKDPSMFWFILELSDVKDTDTSDLSKLTKFNSLEYVSVNSKL